MKKQLILLSFAVLSLTMQSAFARTISINMTNLMHGTYITPQIAATHTSSYTMFEVGDNASAAIQTMAETGSVAGLNKDSADSAVGKVPSTSDQIINTNGTNSTSPIILLAPGTSRQYTASINLTESNTHLSIAGMLMPSNDGFVGLNSWKIPAGTGSWIVYLNAYDAGTEANTEQTHDNSVDSCNTVDDEDAGGCNKSVIPFHPDAGNHNSAPFGTGGTAVATTDNNTKIHIHRGHLGELDSTDDTGDLSATVHRWLNPVAKVVITISE